jgi:hypothetical protein
MTIWSDIISGYVSLVTNDDGAVQLIQGEGEQQDDAGAPEATPDMAVMLPYGFSHNAPVGSDVIAVQVEGRAEQTVIAVQSRPDRPKGLSIGQVVLHLLAGKVLVSLDPADETLHLGSDAAPDWVSLASLVLAELQDVKADLDGFKTKFDAHTHLVSTTGSAAAQSGTAAAVLPAQAFPTPHTPASVASEVVRCV